MFFPYGYGLITPAAPTSTKNKILILLTMCISAAAAVSVVILIVNLYQSSDTHVHNNNTLSQNPSVGETSAEMLVDWWLPSVQNKSAFDTYELNKIYPIPPSGPPTCCWPLTGLTPKTDCLLFETHVAYCATQRHSKCDNRMQKDECKTLRYLPPPDFSCAPRVCCKAMTASCLSCGFGIPVEAFCKCNPRTLGCKT